MWLQKMSSPATFSDTPASLPDEATAEDRGSAPPPAQETPQSMPFDVPAGVVPSQSRDESPSTVQRGKRNLSNILPPMTNYHNRAKSVF